MDVSKVILETRGINKRFPGVHALKDVAFNLRSGEIQGLVGHNGAGKSTLVKVLTGAYIPEAGDILLDGEKVVFHSPKDAIAKGIGIVTQEGTLIPSFTGIQNIFLGQEDRKMGVVLEKVLEQKGRDLLSRTDLDMIDLKLTAEELSPAQRKIVEILKIINMNPRIVIFDESTAALSDRERKLLFDIMYSFRDKGIGVVFITHYIEEVLMVCDRITVMRDGQNVGELDGKTATKHDIVKLMINKEQKSEFPEYERKIGEVLLEAEHVSDGHMVKDATFHVKRGEVVGLFGTVGAGRTELGEAIFGARAITSGVVKMKQKEIRVKNTMQAIKEGMALIPDDRLKKALMLEENVIDNITLPFLKDYTKGNIVNRAKEVADVEETIRKLDIKTPSAYTKVNSLSGGNKQKVSFGKWITGVKRRTDFFIFDEPTEGVDVGACAEMYKIIADLVQDGAGCLVISSDLAEVIGLSDRVYIMREGVIVAEFCRGEADLQHHLIATSLGANEGEEVQNGKNIS